MDLELKQKIEQEFLDNDMYKLNKICRYLIFKKNVPSVFYDDLYSIGRLTFAESIKKYDTSKDCKFETYLIGNIWRAFYDWTRDNMRWKRCNFQTDKDGKIMQDENGDPIIISDMPLDAPTDDGIDLCERIASDFKIEDNLSEEIGFSSDDKIEKYLSRLSKRQRKIVLLLADGYSQDEIRELLHISKKEYTDSLLSIRAYENIRILL